MKMNEEQLKKLVLEIMSNKKEVLNFFSDAMCEYERTIEGLRKVIVSLDDPETSKENIQYQLKTTMQVLAKQSQMIYRMLLVTMIFVGSDEFEKTLAHVACKLGAGQEALQQMFKNKFKT